MKKFLIAFSLLLASMSVHAVQLTLNFDALNFSKHNNGSKNYRAPDFYIGNIGDEPLYHLFYARAQFESDIFMFNYDNGEIGQLITEGNGDAPYFTLYEPNRNRDVFPDEWTDPDTGFTYYVGTPPDVDGWLRAITDENGRTWDQYAVFVAPVGLLTVEMIQAYDFNISGFRQYFNRRNSTAFYNQTGLERSSSYEFYATIENYPYPYPSFLSYESDLNLNRLYSLNNPSSNVPEPATAGLLALAGLGLFFRRKYKA